MIFLKSPFSYLATATCLVAGIAGAQTPSLIITDEPLPAELRQNIYARPGQPTQITADQILAPNRAYNTLVTKKINDLRLELRELQALVSQLSTRLNTLERKSQQASATYFASVATISTQLQGGTTPGNPRLLDELGQARTGLESLSNSLTDFNALAADTSQAASIATYLLEASRSAYGLTGAVEADHVLLSQLEDSVNTTLVLIDRIQNNVNDDITRTGAYLASEQTNLRTLTLAVNNGDFYSRSLASRPFSNVQSNTIDLASRSSNTPNMPQASNSSALPMDTMPNASQFVPDTTRPLARIKFDKPNVQYSQPVYTALTTVLSKNPNARFELIAITPESDNPALMALEGTRARRNAERVLRTLTQMGIDQSQLKLANASSDEVNVNEVHIFIR